MGDKIKKNSGIDEESNSENSSDRRGLERRCRKSLGHMYISTVGWICRREKSRRKDEEIQEDD